MTKIVAILVALTIISVANAKADPSEKPCWGAECTFKTGGHADQQVNITNVVAAIDKEVRRAYWYYLRGANLLYQANIDAQQRFIDFFIYRNVVGTFLVIGSWYKGSQQAEVNTFVRLGNGYSKDIETPYSPVDIDPFIISLRLKQGEFLIEMDEDGNFKINGNVVNIQENQAKTFTQEEIDGKCSEIDTHVREKYWYYLRGAQIIHKESILTTQRVYCLITYINIVGTFLVIGSTNSADVIQVNTFVRLGAGSTEAVRPIAIQPTVVEIN